MKRQRGFGFLEIAIILAIVTIAGGVVYTYNTTIAENATLKGNLNTLQTAHQEQLTENYQMQQENKRLDRLLAARRGRQDAEDQIRRLLDVKLNQIFSTSPEARKWADTPVPAELIAGVRNRGAAGQGDKNAKAVPAGKPAAANAGP